MFRPIYIAAAVFLWLTIILLIAIGMPAEAGHDQGEPRSLIEVACASPASVVGIIRASKTAGAGAFFNAQLAQGRCKMFPSHKPLNFWFEKVVIDDLVWADGDLMYVLQGHDRSDFVLFTWSTAKSAHARGWLPGGAPDPGRN